MNRQKTEEIQGEIQFAQNESPQRYYKMSQTLSLLSSKVESSLNTLRDTKCTLLETGRGKRSIQNASVNAMRSPLRQQEMRSSLRGSQILNPVLLRATIGGKKNDKKTTQIKHPNEFMALMQELKTGHLKKSAQNEEEEWKECVKTKLGEEAKKKEKTKEVQKGKGGTFSLHTPASTDKVDRMVRSDPTMWIDPPRGKRDVRLQRNTRGWKLCRKLGQGRFGEVRMCVHEPTGMIAAAKVLSWKKLKQQGLQSRLREQIEVLWQLSHPNIVNLYDFFSVEDEVWLIMELVAQGTLFDLNAVKLPLVQAVGYLKQIVQAVRYLHSLNIAHRDLKPENVVVCFGGIVKLCDFGCSTLIRSPRRTYCGTLEYSSPEMLQHRDYDHTVDIWGLGVLLYQLLTSSTPFQADHREAVRNNIVNVNIFYTV